MIPVNQSTGPCAPISSNCVIWQGPDIPCINLCTGDTVSDVIAKLATELCDLIDATCECNPDVTSLNLDCLPANTPLTLNGILQAIITYLCDITPATPIPCITVPSCLQNPPPNPACIPIWDFAILLGTKICAILTSITTVQTALTALTARVATLEACVLPCTESVSEGPSVISSCLFPSTLVPISELVLALEYDFCSFRNAVGNVSLVNTAVSTQCIFGNTNRLSGSGTYSSSPGWVSSPATLAESNINQWLVLCDLYSAISDIKENCCTTGCSSVDFEFSYQLGGGGLPPSNLILNFNNSTIPAGFTDCNGITVVTLTDYYGTSVTQNLNISSLKATSTTANVSLTGLNTNQAITLSIPFCVSDGSSTCSEVKTVIIPINLTCPTKTVTSTNNLINIVITNALGTSAIYTIVAIDTTTGLPIGSTTLTNQASIINYAFSGGIVGRTYNVITTLTYGPSTITCPIDEIVLVGATSYNCVQGECVLVQGPGGAYVSLEQCLSSPCPPEEPQP